MTLRCGGRSRPPGSSSLTITGEERAYASENLEGASRRDEPTTMSKRPRAEFIDEMQGENDHAPRARGALYACARPTRPRLWGCREYLFRQSIIPAFRTMSSSWGPVAQRLEPAAHNGLVGGSSPPGPTTQSARTPFSPRTA